MKRNLLLIAMVLVPVISVMGCATSGDLEKMQAQQKMTDAKVEQAIQDAQAARTAADEARKKAEEATTRAETAEKAAAEREKLAEEKAKRADAVFLKSMKK